MGGRGTGAAGGAARGARGAPAVTIRRATARDARRLTALVVRSGAYRGPYAPMVDGYRVGGAYIEAHEVYAAVASAGAPPAERIVGFYALLLDPAELDLLFVADDVQGRGIGRLLVDHMRSVARAAGADHVHVVSHPPAEGFYRGVGAVPAGTRRATPPAVLWDRPELDIPTAPVG